MPTLDALYGFVLTTFLLRMYFLPVAIIFSLEVKQVTAVL